MKSLQSVEENKTDNVENYASNEHFLQYLTFNAGNDMYGIKINRIKEVLEQCPVTKVPLTSNSVRGVLNLRGEIVTVVDLSSRFYRRRADITKQTCTIIVEIKYENKPLTIGVMIDSINSVFEILPGNIKDVPEFGAKIRKEFINGIAKVNDDFVILLNMEEVLNINELSELKSGNTGYSL